MIYKLFGSELTVRFPNPLQIFIGCIESHRFGFHWNSFLLSNDRFYILNRLSYAAGGSGREGLLRRERREPGEPWTQARGGMEQVSDQPLPDPDIHPGGGEEEGGSLLGTGRVPGLELLQLVYGTADR